MADKLDYQFGAMLATNEKVEQRLKDFRSTLESFKQTYTRLANSWGGDAARNARQVAGQIDGFGTDTAAVVNRFLTELNTHLEDSKRVEANNAQMFG